MIYKIVIDVPMHCDKARSKAMKIAVAVQGVRSVSIGENNRLEVTGEEVDSVCLAYHLRKKFRVARIISIGEDRPPRPPPPPPPPPPPYWPPLYYERSRVYEDAPPNCSMM